MKKDNKNEILSKFAANKPREEHENIIQLVTTIFTGRLGTY